MDPQMASSQGCLSRAICDKAYGAGPKHKCNNYCTGGVDNKYSGEGEEGGFIGKVPRSRSEGW